MLRNEKALAREDFKKLVSLLPDSAHAHFLYANALARSGQKARARKEIERAVDVDATYLPGRIGEVKMFVQHNKLNEAKAAMEKVKEDFGDIPPVLALDGWLALGLGDYSRAEKSLSAANEQIPSSEIALLLFRSLWLQGEHEQAYAVLNTRLEQKPNELALLEELAAAKLAQGKKTEALDAYHSVVEDHPDHVLALNNLAWLSRDQDLDQAIAYAAHAQQLAPEAAGVADTLAMLLLQKDSDSKRGFKLLEKSSKQAPANLEIQLHYATVLAQRKMYTQARAVLNTVVKSAPNSAMAIEATERLEALPH